MEKKAKILIVDDEYEKARFIINLMGKDVNTEFDHVSNSQEALAKLKTSFYDLLIIDLQIPEALGDEISPEGGRNLLEYIDTHDGIKRPTHILGLTNHSDSYEDCQESFQSSGWSLIHGLEDDGLIKSIISAKIRHIIDPPQKYDVAILTALESVELEAVLNLPCGWIPVQPPDDCNIYYSGTITTKDKKEISIIATSCHHMGIAQAAAIGMKMCLRYEPSYIFMTGIAAGIKGKVAIGDILVADPCWDWGSGKQTVREGKTVFTSAPRQLALAPSLRAKFKKISTKREFLDQIYNDWPVSNRPVHALNIHIGPVATGSVVLEDVAVVDMIKSQHRETIGIEMEAYGLALASTMSRKDPPKAIIIKSVCDFADPTKNDDWQTYAAYTSAQLAMKFIQNELEI